MRLTIDGSPRAFTPIKAFRAAHNLPPDFGVALFEPKDYAGLGRIDHAGAELNSLRAAVIAALPSRTTPAQWISFIPQLTRRFTDQLYAINTQVKLRDVEIEFAAAGFADVCQALGYALFQPTMPPFEAIYGRWLDETTRISQTVHHYGDWRVQIVTHAYGRAGLIVYAGDETYYVQDAALGCPAEGFMAALLAEVAAHILAS